MDVNLFDINQDGVVDNQDVALAQQLFNTTTADIISRYVNGGTRAPYDIDGDGFVRVLDVTAASNAGVPFEITIDIFAHVAGITVAELSPQVYNGYREQFLAQASTSPVYSWYPIPYNSLFPISSAPAPSLAPEPQAPSFTYDENFHPLDFNKDNNVDILDAQLGAQLFNESTVMMVTKFIQDENPFDLNGDGNVDIQDVLQASSQGIAPHIIQYMQNLILNPPYDPTPPVQPNGSTYHPLDLNQDGNVDVGDLVALGTNSVSFEIQDSAKPLIGQMIQKYSLGQNPYDINNDGNVDVLDILEAVNSGVPQAILQDMQNNLYTQAPPPPPEPFVPGIHENLNSNGLYADVLKMLRWRGPMHKEVDELGKELYFTGATKLPTRRLLVRIDTLPNPNLVKDAEGLKPNKRPFMSNGGGQY